MTPTNAEIMKCLDEILQSLSDRSELIALEYELDDTITARFKSSIPKDLPATAALHLSDKSIQHIPVLPYQDVEIVSQIGDIDRHPPQRSVGVDGEMGGDLCQAAGDMGRYGTIALYGASARFETKGRCNYTIETSPALVSNNHVIARNDAAAIGERVWTNGLGQIAALSAFIPINCNVDIAFARVDRWSSVRPCAVRSLGSVNPNPRETKRGEDIFKHGARTGYTSGIVEAMGMVQIGRRLYTNVFRTSRGFGCPGDSGSLVVGDGRQALGLYSWGELRPCEDDPKGWFFPLLRLPSALDESADALEVRL